MEEAAGLLTADDEDAGLCFVLDFCFLCGAEDAALECGALRFMAGMVRQVEGAVTATSNEAGKCSARRCDDSR